MSRIYPTRRGSLLPGVIFAMTVATGCSSEGSVSGKVTYQGKPLTGGTVLYTSGHGTRSSPIGEDGSYTISGLPTGVAKIAVETKSAQGGTGPGAAPKGPIPGAPKGGPAPVTQPPKGVELPPGAASTPLYNPPPKRPNAAIIPETYANPETSGLTYTVVGGAQEHNVELK